MRAIVFAQKGLPAIFLSSLVVLAGCSKKEPAAEVAAVAVGKDSAPRSVSSPWVAARSPLEVSLFEAPAEVLPPPDANGSVVPPFAARIVQVFAQHGERVEKGDPIASVLMPEVVRAAAAYGAAGTRLAAHGRRKAQLEGLRKEGLARLSEVSEVEASHADAAADQQMALGTLKIAGLGPKDAAALVASGGVVTLKSPIAGVVTEIDAPIGGSRDPNGSPIATIAGTGASRVEARFAHAPPEGATFLFVESSGKTHALKLISQAPGTSGRDGTIAAWFEPSEPLALPHGTLGKLRVSPDARSALVAVPASAVALQEGKTVVVGRKAGGPGVAKVVKVVATSGADALVEGDLKPGDEVASDAARALGSAEMGAQEGSK